MNAARTAIALVAALLSAAAAGTAPAAAARHPARQGAPAAQQGAPAAQQGAPAAQQEESGSPAPAEQEQEQAGGSILLGQLPELSLTVTPEEEAALRLVDQILREQNVIVAGENFVYRAEGRRDPFLSLLQRHRRELAAPETRPPGLAGFLISEVQVSAVARYQGRWHVLLIGLDRRSYVAQVGTELYDGRIVEINAREVIFEQQVEDLLGARGTRRVVKPLRGEDD